MTGAAKQVYGVLAALALTACADAPPSPYVDLGPVMDAGPTDMAAEDASTTEGTTFDPSAVYLHGTLSEGACYLDAVDDFDPDTRPLAGFDCGTRGAGVVRPTDGSLIYQLGGGSGSHLRVFTADQWGGNRSSGFTYPEIPELNDERLDTPECAGLSGFRIEPGSGDILYRCNDCAPGVACDGIVYRAAGGTYSLGPDDDTFGDWWPGYDGIALRGGGFDMELAVEDAAAIPIETALSDFPTSSNIIRAVRATPTGFRVVTLEGLYFTSFLIARDGTVSLEGAFPRWGDEYTNVGSCQLAGDGSLFCQARRMGGSDDLVFRFDLGASEPVIVHDEADDPTVLLHISHLFTGP